jgi:peroxiredoxin
MLRQSSDTLSVGNRAPDFALPTVERQIVRLSQFRGRPVVIVFIRGTW